MRVMFAALLLCCLPLGCGQGSNKMFQTVSCSVASVPAAPPYKSPPSEPEQAKGLPVPPAPPP
jgi:hypothetical protein